jgi:hypothetical protein
MRAECRLGQSLNFWAEKAKFRDKVSFKKYMLVSKTCAYCLIWCILPQNQAKATAK